MFGQVFDQALCTAWEASGVWDLLTQGHFEDLVGVTVHERRSAHEQLVNEDAKGVPVRCSAVADVEDDLRRDVLGCAAQRVGALPGLQPLDEAEVCELYVAIVRNKHVLRLQVPVDEVSGVHVVENQRYLRSVKLDHLGWHPPAHLLQDIQQLSVLQEVHQNVQVAAVLGDSSHLAHHWTLQLCHVLYLLEQVLLLLGFKYLLFADDLHSVNRGVVLLRGHRGLPLNGRHRV